MVNCLQINLNRSRSAQDLLCQHILEMDIELCAVSEPSWPGNSLKWFGSADGNSLLFVRSTCRAKIIKRRFLVAARCADFTLVSGYVSPNVSLSIFISFLEEIKSLVRWIDGPTILCGDFNVHSRFWGSPQDNRRGILLMDYMAEFDFRLINVGNVFTCCRQQGNSIVDLTWASAGAASFVNNWRVEENLASLSDHLYISFTFRSRVSSAAAYRDKSFRWNVRKMKDEEFTMAMDWSMYTHALGSYSGDPNNFADWIVSVASDALDFSTPKISGNIRRCRIYWWNEEIRQSRRRAIAARRAWCRCRRRLNDDDPHYLTVYACYKKSKRDLKKLIKKAKGAAWRELILSINEDPWGLPYKLVLSKLRKSGPGLTEQLPNKTLDTLLQDLFPVGKLLKQTRWPPTIWDPDLNVSWEEVYNIIRLSKKSNSAPGPDGIKFSVWKKIPGITITKMADCFTLCLKEGCFPEKWKTADLILIPKADHTIRIPKVRPICLIDTISKIFEKVINIRLTEFLSTNPGSSLSRRQYGFRQRRSTNDALLDVRRVISSATDEGSLVMAVSLDISNAFNSIPFTKIRRALYRKRVPDYLRKIIFSYLTGRRIRYKDNKGAWRFREVTAGVPQGSVLGPLLWNVAYDTILRTLLQDKNEIFCFADDTLILLVAESMDHLSEYVATDLRRVLKAITDLGLRISENKTNIMLFGGRSKDLPTVRIGGSNIVVKRHMKYLGVIIDHKWNFINHFKYVMDKAGRVTRALERIMPNVKGPGQNKRRLYAEVILSVLLYASPLWFAELSKSRPKRAGFNRILRRMCVRVICAYRTTSTDAALILADIPPLHLMAEARGNSYLRIMQTVADGFYSADLADGIKNEERDYMYRKWRRYIQNHSLYGAHTTRAILPFFDQWTRRKFGHLNYYLTQFFTSHGCFGAFLFKIGKRNSPLCLHCNLGVTDSPEHTLFVCDAWTIERRGLLDALGAVTSLAELVGRMLHSQDKWTAACYFAKSVLMAKGESVRGMESAGSNSPLPGLQDWDSDIEQ